MSRDNRDEADRAGWITGLGAITPIGLSVPAFTRSLRAGASGVRPLSFRNERIRSSVAGECIGFDPGAVVGEADAARVPRLVPMALAAAREAAAQAGLALGEALSVEHSRRVGVILGTGGGGIDFTLEQADRVHVRGERASLWSITNATHGNLAGELSIRLGLRGPSYCISTGCASSSDAAGLALDLLRAERAGTPDAWIVVGADAHVRWETLAAMEMLRVISTRRFTDDREAATASRPFDRTRDGFVLGEGAWAIVLERPRAAAARGAGSVGELLGYGATCDAFHRVRPEPSMEESARAMRLAIADAGLTPEDIEAVHYHGTATQLNDALETSAVKLALGERARRVPGHSVKSMIGHPQGACGLASLVSTLACLTAQDTTRDAPEPAFLHPTINLSEPDPACDLDYTTPAPRTTDARTAMINCLAFGAKNSTLIVRAGAGE